MKFIKMMIKKIFGIMVNVKNKVKVQHVITSLIFVILIFFLYMEFSYQMWRFQFWKRMVYRGGFEQSKTMIPDFLPLVLFVSSV